VRAGALVRQTGPSVGGRNQPWLTHCSTTLIGLDPFPVPMGSRPRRVVGIDVWCEARPTAAAVLAIDLRRALLRTHCRLRALTPDPEGLNEADPPRVRGRIVADRDDVHVTDTGIADVLEALSHRSLVRKLEEFDGIPGYPPIGQHESSS